MSSPAASDLSALKAELLALTPGAFERLVAALIGRLLGVGVAIAKSGFQHGGDAGTAGRQGRLLRIETKRYAETTSLGQRELLGELEQACQRDPALELWVLGATTEAEEQLEQDLFESGRKQGVAVLVIDWKPGDAVPALAALCAASPETVEEFAGARARELAERIAPFASPAIEALEREFAAWQVGYAVVADCARLWLERLWASPAESVAALGQDAAGGAKPASIVRAGIAASLDGWQAGPRTDSPALLVGEEGLGKTWAGIAWLVANAASLPIVLIIPSGLVVAAGSGSSAGLYQLLAARLHEITGVRDPAFWTARVRRMLERPADEGPAFLVMLDGLNQEPSAPWTALLQNLQATPFASRVQAMATVRPMFLEDRLRNLGSLVVPPTRIDVEPYDDAPGGELDQMLALHGIERGQLRDELIPFARIPRLFELVVDLRDRLAGVERVTVHGLLWEYGRDTLGTRGGRAFSESEWRAWLAEVAERFRDSGSPRLTRREVEATASRPTLAPGEVYARLSDIVDGHVAHTGPAGGVTVRPEIVAQALGVAVIAHLEEIAAHSPATMPAALDQWLDPISGFSERAEVLRASVAILCDSGATVDGRVADAVVAAWLATQNLPENHRRDVLAVAHQIVPSLIAAVESMSTRALSSARDIAIEALRSLPRSDAGVRDRIAAAATRWMRVISRGVEGAATRSDEVEQRRAQHMIARTGSDADGPRTILGQQVIFVPRSEGQAFTQAASVIEGYPLAPFTDLFELAALQLAIRQRLDVWSSLKWLVLWNETDFAETAAALQARAEEVLSRPVEVGVEPRLRQRVAALLLWLSADPAVEQRARDLDPRLDAFYDYPTHYEANPATSNFKLERRHAEQVLGDTGVPIAARVRRLDGLWWEPGLTVTPAVASELEGVADAFEMTRLRGGRFRSADDTELDRIEAALARGAPAGLARLARRRIQRLATLEDARERLADAAYDVLLVGDGATLATLHAARRPDAAGETDADAGVAQLLLQPELVDLDAEAQVDAILAARLPHLYTNINPLLRPLDAAAIDRLIERYGDSDALTVERLVDLLSVRAEALSEDARVWLEARALDADFGRREVAYQTLARCTPEPFGRALLAADWSWNREENESLAHYGSVAVMRASVGFPFESIAHRIAPWLLARAARERGGAPAEVRLAAQILDRVVRVPRLEAPDTGSQLSVDSADRTDAPFSLSLTPGVPSVSGDVAAQLNAMMNQDRSEEASRRAVDVAVARIREARDAGASLFLASVDDEDLLPMLRHADDLVDGWCEGMEARTPDFRRRVRLAEGFYVALTEAMIRTDLDRGIALWNAVRDAMVTKFVATAGIDLMILMLLSAPADARTEALVREIVAPAVASNDEVLFDIAIAAAAARRESLIAAIAAEDRASAVRWRIERAKALEAFAPGADAPPVFPDGRSAASAYRDAEWGERRYRDRAARHWWDAYWSAPDGETAFAHWTSFEHSVDRRAVEWVRRDWPAPRPEDRFFHRKWVFARSRRSGLRRAAEDLDRRLSRHLFAREIEDDIAPWTKLAPVNRS